VKTLTLTQPWATLLISGVKRFETRGWSTPYRGELAIHAAKRWTEDDMVFAQNLIDRGLIDYQTYADLPHGAVLGTARLVAVDSTIEVAARKFTSALELELGDFSDGRYAWEIGDPQPFHRPVAARGALGLWTWLP
jgi:hypothetical protein